MISSLAVALKKKTISLREVTSFVRERVLAQSAGNDIFPNTNCLTYFHEDLDNASKCKDSDNHPLFGIPFTVKDNFHVKLNSTKRIPLTCGSKALQNFYSLHSAPVVESFLSDGALFVGKCNMDEFAMGCGSVDNELHGAVVNPWSPRDSSRIAGGSSGGSAASIAAGISLFSLASDTGGSTRLPAALCGIVGFKPSYGLVSRNGMVPLANQLDTPSLMAPRVEDIGTVLSSWIGNPSARKGDSTLPEYSLQRPKKGSLKIGIPMELSIGGLSREVKHLWDQVADRCHSDLGHTVVPVSLPHAQYSLAVYTVICCVAVASNMSRYDGIKFGYRSQQKALHDTTVNELISNTRAEALGDIVRQRILTGNYFLMKDQRNLYLQTAQRFWRLIKQDFDKVFEEVDFLLTPVHLQPAEPIEEFKKLDSRTRTTRDDVFTVPVNLAGLPAIAIPLISSMNDSGLPLGLQLIGPRWSDLHLLHFAQSIERIYDFPLLFDFCKEIGVNRVP